jgi:hypothetical protein
MPGGHLTVHIASVERAIPCEGRDGTPDLVEQRTDLRAIIDIRSGQLGGDDLAGVGVNAKV